MNIKELLYFTQIAETKSLSAAAKKLGVSQPTLSTYLSGLEKDMGAKLFYSEKRQLLPTVAGQIYLDAAKQIIAVHNQTYLSIHNMTRKSEKKLFIGATPHRGATKIAQVYHLFSRQYPDVELCTMEHYMPVLREKLKNEELPLALGACADENDPDLMYAIFSEEEVYVAVPAFHPLAQDASEDPDHLNVITLDQVCDIPMITLPKGCAIRALSDKRFAQAKLNPTIVTETNNNNVIHDMVALGNGFGFLPRSSMKPGEKDVRYFRLEPALSINLSVMLKKDHVLTDEERYLLYLFIKHEDSANRYTIKHNRLTTKIIDFYEKEDLK